MCGTLVMRARLEAEVCVCMRLRLLTACGQFSRWLKTNGSKQRHSVPVDVNYCARFLSLSTPRRGRCPHPLRYFLPPVSFPSREDTPPPLSFLLAMASETAPPTPFTPEQCAWLRETFGPSAPRPVTDGMDPMEGSSSQGPPAPPAGPSSGE